MTPDVNGPAPLDINTEAGVVPLEDRPPVTRRLSAWWLVLVVALAAFVLLALDHLRYGMVVLGASMLLGAGLRAVLPAERAGGLVVRSRVLDVIVLVVLGAGVIVAGLALRSR